jgi:dihydroorotate dehydrogenase
MIRSAIKGTIVGSAAALGLLYIANPQSSIHKSLVLPLLHTLSPEDSHKLAIFAASWGLSPRDHSPDDPRLALNLFGKEVTNPIGLAAGFDKNGEAVDGMFDIGFGFVELGSGILIILTR